MAETLLQPGDEIDVVVTSVKPFGFFVRTDAGMSGLVRGAGAETGATVRVRVIETDAVESRFSAKLA